MECIVIGFSGNTFDGSIAREIKRVVESGTIRLGASVGSTPLRR